MKKITHFFLCTALLVLGACASKPPAQNLTEADKRLLAIIKSEIGVDAVIKGHPHSRWVYLPVTFDFFQIKVSDEEASAAKDPQIATSLRFIDVNYSGKQFAIAYDVGDTLSYPKTFGYTNAYTAKYQAAQSAMLSAIPRAYGDLKNPPDFFIIVFGNIATGIEMRLMAHSKDIIRANSDHSFGEEFARRFIQEQPIGSKEVIDDFYGKHIKDYDMTWPEFLSRQIKYRIEFKYTHSAFPPTADTLQEMLAQAVQSLQAYSFEDYEGILMIDRKTDEQKVISRPELWSLVDGASQRSLPAVP